MVQRARNDDYQAFEQLVDRHEQRLFSLALGILRRPEDAEDVVQSTFLSALEHLDNFRGDASFATWISRIATNKALSVLRKRRGLPSVSLNEAGDEDEYGSIPHPEYIADWREDPRRSFERRELRQILDAAIDSLADKYRVVFILRDVQGFDIQETARMLNLSPSNVKVRLLRARLALRERLTRVFGDENRRVFPHQHHRPGQRGGLPAGMSAPVARERRKEGMSGEV